MQREIRQGEVWWVGLDPVRGSEQAKRRPVLVVSVDEINRAPAGLSIVCPLTTTPRDAAVRVALPRKGDGVRIGWIEPYQVRTVSHDRFGERLAVVDHPTLTEVARRIELFTRPASILDLAGRVSWEGDLDEMRGGRS